MIEYAISFKQPWAYLTAAGLKPIDNRTRRSNFRGKFYIHASKGVDDLAVTAWWLGVEGRRNSYKIWVDWSKYEFPGVNALTKGAIIGEAEVTDTFDIIDYELRYHGRTSEWFVGPYGLLIENAKLYDTPIPYSGMVSVPFKVSIPIVELNKAFCERKGESHDRETS